MSFGMGSEMKKEDVRRAKHLALGLTIFFGVMISYAKFAGLFTPPNLQNESRYGPPGWFSSFDLGPPPFPVPPEFQQDDGSRPTPHLI